MRICTLSARVSRQRADALIGHSTFEYRRAFGDWAVVSLKRFVLLDGLVMFITPSLKST